MMTAMLYMRQRELWTRQIIKVIEVEDPTENYVNMVQISFNS